MPRTTCNGPVMFSSRERLAASVAPRPPDGDDRVIIGAPDVRRTGGWPARGSHAVRTAVRTIAGAVRALLTGNPSRCARASSAREAAARPPTPPCTAAPAAAATAAGRSAGAPDAASARRRGEAPDRRPGRRRAGRRSRVLDVGPSRPRSASAIRTTRMSSARSSSSRRFSSHSTRSGERPRHGSVYLTRPSNSTATAASSNHASTTRDQSARRPGSRPGVPARGSRHRRSAAARVSPAATRPGRPRGRRPGARPRAPGQLPDRRGRVRAVRLGVVALGEQRGVHGDDGVLERPLAGAVDQRAGRGREAQRAACADLARAEGCRVT